MKDRVLWTQENCVVAEIVEGEIEVIPLFPHMLPAPTKEEPVQVDDATVIEMYKMGCTYETVMAKTGLKYHRVQRIISEAKKRGEVL